MEGRTVLVQGKPRLHGGLKHIQRVIQEQLISNPKALKMGANLLEEDSRPKDIFGRHHDNVMSWLTSLTVLVSEPAGDHEIEDLQVVICQLENGPSKESDDDESSPFTQGDIFVLPNTTFETTWTDLVFQSDIKQDLIRMTRNMVRCSQSSIGISRDLYPIILFHGPPGTGKTSLCHGLAQTLSIYTKTTYPGSILIQINTASLLSKYFSESAKQVDEIFQIFEQYCRDDEKRLVFVIIDEIEGLVGSRNRSIDHGEAHDGVRATNAVLTGIDRTKGLANLFYMCTTNLPETIDPAFLDRCGHTFEIDTPSQSAFYSILRGRISKLVTRGIISTKEPVPHFLDRASSQVGLDLESIADSLQNGELSGRSLSQLPERAVTMYMKRTTCSVEESLGYMKEYAEVYMNLQVVKMKRKETPKGKTRKSQGKNKERHTETAEQGNKAKRIRQPPPPYWDQEYMEQRKGN